MTTLNRTNSLLLNEKNRKQYNENSVNSILSYASRLCGLTFEDILRQNGLTDEDIAYLEEKSMTNKGLLGILVEQAWFGYPANSKQEADFSETGIELKSTPFEGEGESIRPGETLSLTQINYKLPQEQEFYNSHVWEKMQKILLVYYQRQKALAEIRKSKLIYRIHYVFMLKPSKKDLAIIESDYKLLTSFMFRGEADKLSRTHGQYLGVAPKSGKKEFVPQYYGEHIPALKRGYVLKTAYLTFVLHRAAGIIEDAEGTIITNISDLRNKSFSDIITERLQCYVGLAIEDIWQRVKRKEEDELPTSKNSDAIIACRMLGVTNNRVEEFVKAGILPKVIKFCKKRSQNQQFRIEDFKFSELAVEEQDSDADTLDDGERHGWEASHLFSYLADRKYLFLVFWDTEDGCIFKGCQLWGMPDNDLEVVHTAWNKTKEILDKGVQFSVKHDRSGNVSVGNNLPGIADNGIFHIRPHANQSYHVINGVAHGKGKLSDSDALPNGDRITKQAYWLNRAYIESQLSRNLVKKYN